MVRSCKNIDLKNWKTVYPWVRECINKHKDRRDFRKLLCSVGNLNKNEYVAALNGNDQLLNAASRKIAIEVASGIRKRNIVLPPVRMEEKQDKSSLKVRIIGKESAMQQIYDHVACGAADEIWKRRIVPQQASSIKKRGQFYGACMISRWLKKDKRSEEWAKRHKAKYFRKCKYYVKLDAEKCYQNMRLDKFLPKFRRDCGNGDLVWLWETLLSSHRINGYQGFMIGARPSQDACQYLMSFVYRYTMDLHKKRRGKPVRLVNHMMTFMDDLLLFSSSRKDLKTAIRKIIKYAREEFNILIKAKWQICNIEETPVDMMGFLIHEDGNVTVRPRVFIRTRREALRVSRKHGMSYRQARRLCSYKGYFFPRKRKAKRLPTKAFKIDRRLKLRKIFKEAANLISKIERGERYDRVYDKTRTDPVYATT